MTGLLTFWSSHRGELVTLFAQHVVLVAVSTLVAIAIGVPLGIFAARRPRLSAPVTVFANIVQTVPSLAMFGFLLPVPLIGGDGALWWIERRLSARRRVGAPRGLVAASAILGIVLFGGAVLAGRSSGAIVVGSKNF